MTPPPPCVALPPAVKADAAAAAALALASKPAPWTATSRSLDLFGCPAGEYELDFSHPSSALVLRHLLSAAAPQPPSMPPPPRASGDGASEKVVVRKKPQPTVSDAHLDGKTVSDNDLSVLALAGERLEGGILRLTVRAPAVMTERIRQPLADEVRGRE